MINRWVEPPTPWRSPAKDVNDAVQARVSHDALACGLIDLDKPQMDELLHCHGFSAEGAQQWVGVGFQRDSLLRTCQQHGAATGLVQDTGLAGSKIKNDSFVACEIMPLGVGERRAWWICAARASEPFSVGERALLHNLLHEWRNQLGRPMEHGLSMVIVGGDGRVIYADPFLLDRMQQVGQSLTNFVELVKAVYNQRWPEAKPEEEHDLILDLAGEPVWIFAKRQQACDVSAGERWVMEFRPLEEVDLPGIGLLEDDRVAQAVALIHDRYHTSPTLNDLSEAVQVSPFHFHRLFTKQVTISPKQYLLGKQLQVGRWRLRRRLEPIGTIAMATGFANHAHFTSTFRRAMGMSPSAYQQKHMRALDPNTYGAGPTGRKRRKKQRRKKKKG